MSIPQKRPTPLKREEISSLQLEDVLPDVSYTRMLLLQGIQSPFELLSHFLGMIQEVLVSNGLDDGEDSGTGYRVPSIL